MQTLERAKQLIDQAKNVYIVPDQNNQEAVLCGLGLFYTLKELNKNVNLIIEDFPEKFEFLIPSLDYVSYPKNFVISVPNKIAQISQIYYEKNDDNLKIHLTIENGNIKKDNVSFYFTETKPDVVVTIGIKDYKSELNEKLNSYGFLLDSPVLNIDNTLTDSALKNKSLVELALNLVKNPNNEIIKKNAANCFLAGIMIYTENFSNSKLTPEVFQTAGDLMKKDADLQMIKNNLLNNL